MKFGFIEKVIIALITLVLLTILIIKMVTEKCDKNTQILNRQIENFTNKRERHEADQKEQIENEYQSFQYEPYQKQEGFRSCPKNIEGMASIGDQIMRAFQKPFQPLIDFFNKLIKAFAEIPIRVKHFGDAFTDVGDGIKMEFNNLGESLTLGFDDAFDVIGTLGTCGINYLTNFRTCIIWYILDCVGTTLYGVFVELPVFAILKISGLDLQPYVDMIICLCNALDKFCFEYTCYHIFHFPDWVIRDCYSCNFQDKVDKLNKDWTQTIPNLLIAPTQKFQSAKHNFEATISSNP